MTEERTWVLLFALFLVAIWWPRQNTAAFPMVQIEKLTKAFGQYRSIPWAKICRSLFILALLCALLEWRSSPPPAKRETEGLDMVLAVDVSDSMAAIDFKIDDQPADRLMAVKAVLQDFLQKRAEDRFGLVVFGGEVYTAAPVTGDQDTLLKLVDGLRIGGAGEGTAIGDAIAVAVRRIRPLNVKQKLVILLTDGEQTAGTLNPLTAAAAAKDLDIKIYTIAIGSKGRVPIPVRDRFGRQSIQWMESRVDEKSLKAIADETKGRFFRAYDADELAGIYDEIAKMETSKAADTPRSRPQTIDWPWILVAFAALAMEAWLSRSYRQVLPL